VLGLDHAKGATGMTTTITQIIALHQRAAAVARQPVAAGTAGSKTTPSAKLTLGQTRTSVIYTDGLRRPAAQTIEPVEPEDEI
jgi:hypothetical protein